MKTDVSEKTASILRATSASFLVRSLNSIRILWCLAFSTNRLPWFIIQQGFPVEVLKKMSSRLAVLLLAASLILQVLCPSGLWAINFQGKSSSSHSGCHESAPPPPAGPAAPQRCCSASLPSKAAPTPRYAAPALSPVAVATLEEPHFFRSSPANLFTWREDFSPPGLSVL